MGYPFVDSVYVLILSVVASCIELDEISLARLAVVEYLPVCSVLRRARPATCACSCLFSELCVLCLCDKPLL